MKWLASMFVVSATISWSTTCRADGGKDAKPRESQAAQEVSPIHGKSGGRAKVPEDVFAIRSYGAKSSSPDGQVVAIEIKRWAPGARHESGDVIGLNRR